MLKQKHNPETSIAVIIRYLTKDSDQNEIVKKVNGQTEAVNWLK